MPAALSVVTEVHRGLLARFLWASDLDTYGKLEKWARPVLRDGRLVGDCEDFALEAYHRLRAAGVEAHDLALAACATETGERHAVLLVDVDDGRTWVVDNRRRAPAAIAALPYSGWSRSRKGRPITEPWERFTVLPERPR